MAKAFARLAVIDSRRWIAFLLDILPRLVDVDFDQLSDEKKRMLQMFYVTVWGETASDWNSDRAKQSRFPPMQNLRHPVLQEFILENVQLFLEKPLTFAFFRAIIAESSTDDVSGCGAVGSALPWGGRGRKFKSCHSDQIKPKTNRFRLYFLHFRGKIECFSATFPPPEIPKFFLTTCLTTVGVEANRLVASVPVRSAQKN